MREQCWRGFLGTLRCLVGLHAWEPPFRYVYGPYVPRLKPVTEGEPYTGDGHLPRRKERIVMQVGQARCARCLAFKLPNKGSSGPTAAGGYAGSAGSAPRSCPHASKGSQ